MSQESHELDGLQIDRYAAAERALHDIAFSDRFLLPLTFQTALITDAAGHLDRLKDRYGEDQMLLTKVYETLFRFGISADIPELCEQSLSEMDSFHQYIYLYDVLADSAYPDCAFSITDATWQRLNEHADQTARAEAFEADYGSADAHYTRIAKLLLELGVHFIGESDTTAKLAAAETIKAQIETEMTALDGCDRGRLDAEIGTTAVRQSVRDRFDIICGKAGLWQAMFAQNSAQYIVYKTAAGNLEDEDREALIKLASNESQATRLNAIAVLAIEGNTSHIKSYRKQISKSAITVFDGMPLAFAAFLWAAPEKWAESVGSPAHLESDNIATTDLIEIGRPEFGRMIRNRYAEACKKVVKGFDMETDVGAFDLALNMLRGRFVAPSGHERSMLSEYVHTATSISRRLMTAVTADKHGAAESGLDGDDMILAVGAWAQRLLPRVDEVVELESQCLVMEAVLQVDKIPLNMMYTLERNIESQWVPMMVRDSFMSTFRGLRPRIIALLERVQLRIDDLEFTGHASVEKSTAAIAEHITTVVDPPVSTNLDVEIRDNPETGQPYL